VASPGVGDSSGALASVGRSAIRPLQTRWYGIGLHRLREGAGLLLGYCRVILVARA
jgi:hypothetical protein